MVSMLFFQCQKELGYVGAPDPEIKTPTIVTPDPITANLQGNIIDENNQPAAGVNITVGNKTAITDAKGYFRITGASLDKNTSLVVAQKAGYFKGMRVFAATSGTNQVVIKLIKKNLTATVPAASGGDASLTNGSKISLPANGVVVASSGAAYTGDVKVFAAYIDPTATDISATVPGSFTGNEKTRNRVTLSSFGMLAVELESAAGEKLQIKSGAEATLTTKIPGSRASSAPATIALWSVDEQTGIWKEEGTATKQGDSYVGTVKHFSFWNCDQPMNAVNLSLALKDVDSVPIVYAQVRITRSGTGLITQASGYTDSLGQVSGLVPSNEALLLEVIDRCGNVTFSRNLQPLTQNTNLGVVYAASATGLVTVKGKVLNCAGAVVKNGYAIIHFGNYMQYASTDSDGNFVTKIFTCSSTPTVVDVTGVDNITQQESSSITVPITAPLTYTPIIIACGISSSQYINYTVDGNTYNITSAANDSLVAFYMTQGATTPYVSIMGNLMTDFTKNISFNAGNPTGVGTFPLSTLSVNNMQNILVSNASRVTFTAYATTVGEFYEGTVTAQFTSGTATVMHTLDVTFRVRRTW